MYHQLMMHFKHVILSPFFLENPTSKPAKSGEPNGEGFGLSTVGLGKILDFLEE